MPRLRNPTAYRLAYDSTGELLGPGESVEITEEQAARFADGCVFVVERGPSSTPKREKVTRGSKRAEVTKAPKPETRGLTTGDWLPR